MLGILPQRLGIRDEPSVDAYALRGKGDGIAGEPVHILPNRAGVPRTRTAGNVPPLTREPREAKRKARPHYAAACQGIRDATVQP